MTALAVLPDPLNDLGKVKSLTKLLSDIIFIVESQTTVTAETCKLMDDDVTGDPQLDVIVNVIENVPMLVVSKLNDLHAVDVSP